jgi:ketosteroid isomerase-like protein
MSRNNAQLVREIYEALVQGNKQPLLAALALDVEWHNPADAIEPGVRQGREAFGAVLDGIFETFDYTEITIEDLVERDERIAVALRVQAEGRGSRVPIDQRFGHVLDIRDGQVVRFEWFFDPEEAIRAAGGRAD